MNANSVTLTAVEMQEVERFAQHIVQNAHPDDRQVVARYARAPVGLRGRDCVPCGGAGAGVMNGFPDDWRLDNNDTSDRPCFANSFTVQQLREAMWHIRQRNPVVRKLKKRLTPYEARERLLA